MKSESPFIVALNKDHFDKLQSDGMTVRELRHSSQSNYPGLVEECYHQWRNGNLLVSRQWGKWQTEAKRVEYHHSACLLPDDKLLLRQANKESSIYKIATWNVNSIRSRIEILIQWLKAYTPDIVCLQETKVEDVNFPIWEIEKAGYQSFFLGQKSYNGVAILSRHPLEEVFKGFENSYDSDNARIISATWKGIRLINVYIPQGQNTESDKFLYKLEFLNQLLDEIKKTNARNLQMIVLGDFNVALESGDVINPDTMLGKVSYHPNEHRLINQLKEQGFVDLFRHFNQRDHQFTWWDFRTLGYERGEGMRIDHIFASNSLLDQFRNCEIDSSIRGQEKPSDHAPVICVIEI